MKTNGLSALIGVPSLSIEYKFDSNNAINVVGYKGTYEFFGPVKVVGVHVLYRKYFPNSKKRKPRHLGSHFDVGTNWQTDNSIYDINGVFSEKSFWGITTLIGYQNYFGKSNIVFDLSIGNSFPILFNGSSIQPRVTIALGYKLWGRYLK